MGRKRKASSSSNSKQRRRTRRPREKMKEEARIEEVDRISLLPDDILGRILSSFPTKDAVGLSILSKRWRLAWTSVPIIKINDDHLSSEMRDRFMDFVDRVLSLNDVSFLQKFHLRCLTCEDDYDSSRVSSWISSTVMKRDIEKLSLNFLVEDPPLNLVQLPLNMFTSQKLVTLKLCGDIFLNVSPDVVYLPCLKILHLIELQSVDDDSVKNLLAGCPVLEEFHITKPKDGDKLNMVFVQSTSLKRFHVVPDIDSPMVYNDIPIVVDAINLEEIYLYLPVPQQFEVKNRSSSLVKVELHLHPHGDAEMVVYGNSVVELLRQISNTKHLVLSLDAMEALGYTCLDNVPMFHNLTHLKMGMYSCDWPILPYLLDCSPNLVSLFLHNYSSCCGNRECPKQYHTPKCSVLHLGKIELEHFRGERNEMKMVSYLLKNSQVLKKMSIRYHHALSLNQILEIPEKIFALPRGSSDFEIEFIETTLQGEMVSSTNYKLQGGCTTPVLL